MVNKMAYTAMALLMAFAFMNSVRGQNVPTTRSLSKISSFIIQALL